MTRMTFLAAALLCGAAIHPAAAQDIVAQRGPIKLSSADVRDLIAHADPALRAKLQTDPAVLSDFVRSRVLRLAMLADAKAKNWEQNPDVAAKLAEGRDDVIVSTYVASLAPVDAAYPTDAEIAAAYEANKATLVRPRQYQLSQIVMLSQAGGPADEDTRKKMVALRALATKPKADFADLARKNSQDKASADRGGEIGWLREDQLVPAVKDAVSGLQEGGITEPVRTSDGWHVIKLLATRPAGPVPLAEVRDQLVTAMRQQRAQQATKAAVDDALRRDPIQINEIALQAVTK